MMAGPPILALAVIGVMMLGGCGKDSQSSERSERKSDATAWSASSEAVPAYSAGGWKASGDKASWEAQINARTQRQNEYAAR